MEARALKWARKNQLGRDPLKFLSEHDRFRFERCSVFFIFFPSNSFIVCVCGFMYLQINRFSGTGSDHGEETKLFYTFSIETLFVHLSFFILELLVKLLNE